MNQEPPPKSKLIIDEDWKTQVAREKEQFARDKEQTGQSGTPEPQATSTSSEHVAGRSSESEFDVTKLPPPPPANFPLLISTLGTQALAAMGQLPDDDGQAPPARLDYAKHYIDMLGMLEDKTKNNLTPDEAHILADWLHQLRMAFVALTARK